MGIRTELSKERKYLEERVDARVTFLMLFLSASSFAVHSAQINKHMQLAVILASTVLAIFLALSVIRTQKLAFIVIKELKAQHPEHPYSRACEKISFIGNAGYFTGYALPLVLIALYLTVTIIIAYQPA